MHRNEVEYWRYLQSLEPPHPDLPTPRVRRLLRRLFDRWREMPARMPELPHLLETGADPTEPVSVRKARATALTLQLVGDPKIVRQAASFEVAADELILGTLPPYSAGQGKEVVRYLTPDERLAGALVYLNEWSPMGRVVPDYHRLLHRGLGSLIEECEARRGPSPHPFYDAAIISLRAVIDFASAYANEAERVAATLPEGDRNIASLQAAAERLRHVPANPARTFHDAVQSIHIVHTALHWTQEMVPIGRLDQLLFPFYEAGFREGRLTRDEAQEILDCFWIKLDERVVRNRRFMEDRFTSADAALTGVPGSSNFDQGALLNQWMQQITIGGVIADDEPEPKDASNAVTILCIESARRLPLNSPTLDLRVHAGTPRYVLDAAARALLSGGAHPVLLNDDRIVPALLDAPAVPVEQPAGVPALLQGRNGMPLRDARDYACGGGSETMPAGKTEFSFGFVSALDALEKALNRGAGLADAGSQHLRGWKGSYRTNAPADIDSFEDFWTILTTHIQVACHRYLSGLTATYGAKAEYCPSPLLSAFIDGCVESGRDFTAGGPRYHLFAPLMTGISTCTDSLWVIRHCVFGEQLFTLEELVQCLRTNWGNETEYVGPSIAPERVAEIHALVKQQKKFGQGDAEVDELAWRLIRTFTDTVRRARLHPVHRSGFEALKTRYDTPEWPFEIILTPGVATFEQYLFAGRSIGATSDGRRARNGIASDLSPAPVHRDDPPWVEGSDPLQHARQVPLADGLRSYADDVMNLLPNGAPADYNLPEAFPEQELADALEAFARGGGGSIATFTVAGPATFRGAEQNPDEYDLLRVRMGGWSEFFIALFPEHREQHKRRPLSIAALRDV